DVECSTSPTVGYLGSVHVKGSVEAAAVTGAKASAEKAPTTLSTTYTLALASVFAGRLINCLNVDTIRTSNSDRRINAIFLIPCSLTPPDCFDQFSQLLIEHGHHAGAPTRDSIVRPCITSVAPHHFDYLLCGGGSPSGG